MHTTTMGGLTVSAMGLGCMGMSEWYGATDWDESVATIHRALDLGVTLIDTADVYGSGHNEVLVGRAHRRPPRTRCSWPPSSASTAPAARRTGPSAARRRT